MPGAGCARSLACEIKKHTSVVTTVTPVSPDIPRATVYGLFRALPSDRAFLPLSFADSTRDLGASVGASGPHGFAVRLSAVRPQPIRVHRIPSHVRDDREPPLMSRRDLFALFLFLPSRQVKFLKIRNRSAPLNFISRFL